MYCFDGKDLGSGNLKMKKLVYAKGKRLFGKPQLDNAGKWLITRFVPTDGGRRESIVVWNLEGEQVSKLPFRPDSFPEGIRDLKPSMAPLEFFTQGYDNSVCWLNAKHTQVVELRTRRACAGGGY